MLILARRPGETIIIEEGRQAPVRYAVTSRQGGQCMRYPVTLLAYAKRPETANFRHYGACRNPVCTERTRSESVKGCKMPAPSRRPVSSREHSTGRRLTSLEGGNRGVLRCGYFNVSGYGDLKVAFSV